MKAPPTWVLLLFFSSLFIIGSFKLLNELHKNQTVNELMKEIRRHPNDVIRTMPKPQPKMTSPIKQIEAGSDGHLYALCIDGSLWALHGDVPQRILKGHPYDEGDKQ